MAPSNRRRTASPPPVLRLDGVRRRYRSTWALRGVDLSIRPGELVALMGANGAGKSTLVRIAVGLDRPTEGTVARPRKGIGYCPQEEVQYPELTVLENLLFAAALHKTPLRRRRRRAMELIDQVGLSDHRRVRADRLSGGMRRRLTLALALVHDPAVLVVEEPEAGLDPHNRAAIRALLGKLRDSGLGILLTTHDAIAAETIADSVAILDAGHLLAQGDPGSLLARLDEFSWDEKQSSGNRPTRATVGLEELILRMTGAPA